MTLYQAVVLGIVQGLTEFIPISSSAHLIIIPWLFRWDDPGLTFDVSLHVGTLAALVWYFWEDWARLIRAWARSVAERNIGADPDRRLAWFLVIGTIPGILAGLLAESAIEDLFHRPGAAHDAAAMVAMAAIIALLGLALFVAERTARHVRGLTRISLRDTLLIGVSQATAIFPGVSRSGATITSGLALGLRRETAARFSFLLAAPIILGAGVKSLLGMPGAVAAGQMTSGEALLLVVGFLTAAVSGYLAIKFLLRFLQAHSTDIFVYYRWALAAAVAAVALYRG